PEKAKERRNLVLKVMYESDHITEEEMKEAQQTDININLNDEKSNQAHQAYVDQALKEAQNKHGLSMEELKKGGYKIVTQLKEEQKKHRLSKEELKKGGYKIVTPLKEEFQEIAYENFQNGQYFPGNTKGTEGAFVMMDQETGGLVAALGGRQFEITEQNRLNEKRQPGSTM